MEILIAVIGVLAGWLLRSFIGPEPKSKKVVVAKKTKKRK